MEVTRDDLYAVLDTTADAATRRRVALALQVPRSQVNRWLAQIATAATHPLDVDWTPISRAGTDDGDEEANQEAGP